MKEKSKHNNKDIEAGEEQLFTLIKQAGEEARLKKREAMEQHFNKLRNIIIEATARKKSPLVI